MRLRRFFASVFKFFRTVYTAKVADCSFNLFKNKGRPYNVNGIALNAKDDVRFSVYTRVEHE